MINNKILTQDDKKKLADFLFQCLRSGISEKRIEDLAQIWLKKDGKISNKNFAVISDKYGGDRFVYSVAWSILITLPLTVMLSPIAGITNDIGAGLVAGNAALTLLASVVYLVIQYILDKKHASAHAEKIVDAHNIKCYEKLTSDMQDLRNLTNESYNHKTITRSYSCPELNLHNVQSAQHVSNVPPQNTV